MSSPPPDNILEDPVGELEAALRSHAFGLDPASHVVAGSSAPTSTSAGQAPRPAKTSPSARAKLILLSGEGEADVVLDSRGYSIESTTSKTQLGTHTFESLDGLLIALSPAYVEAMQSALLARFAQGVPERKYHDHDDEADEPAWID